MNVYLSKARSIKVLAIALAILWVPYASTLCLGSASTHIGCPMAAAAMSHTSHHGTGHSSHSCCDLTSKCDGSAASTGWTGVPPIALPPTPVGIVSESHVPDAPASFLRIDATHGPPPYLRNLTLLI